jgi:hypothetical protein
MVSKAGKSPRDADKHEPKVWPFSLIGIHCRLTVKLPSGNLDSLYRVSMPIKKG